MNTSILEQPHPVSEEYLNPRRIYNPVQKDYATFLETSAETGGVRTLIEIDLAPGGGNRVHYHLTLRSGDLGEALPPQDLPFPHAAGRSPAA